MRQDLPYFLRSTGISPRTRIEEGTDNAELGGWVPCTENHYVGAYGDLLAFL